MESTDWVDAYTDGACKGNPGPGGWGAVLRFGAHVKELHGGEPGTTNNRMELTAVIRALEALTRPCRVRLHTDSQYVQKGIITNPNISYGSLSWLPFLNGYKSNINTGSLSFLAIADLGSGLRIKLSQSP